MNQSQIWRLQSAPRLARQPDADLLWTSESCLTSKRPLSDWGGGVTSGCWDISKVLKVFQIKDYQNLHVTWGSTLLRCSCIYILCCIYSLYFGKVKYGTSVAHHTNSLPMMENTSLRRITNLIVINWIIRQVWTEHEEHVHCTRIIVCVFLLIKILLSEMHHIPVTYYL